MEVDVMGKSYQVTVGNIGTVYTGASKGQAMRQFDAYVQLSQAGRGRTAGESVTFWADDQPMREYCGTVDELDQVTR